MKVVDTFFMRLFRVESVEEEIDVHGYLREGVNRYLARSNEAWTRGRGIVRQAVLLI